MDIEDKIVAEPAGDSEAGYSSGLRTTAHLPPYEAGEFGNLVDPNLKTHMDALLAARPKSGGAAPEQGQPIATGRIRRFKRFVTRRS